VFKIGERIQEVADECRREFNTEICDGGELFTSKEVVQAISTRDRQIHSEIQARQGLSLRSIVQRIKKQFSIFAIFRLYEDTNMSDLETTHDLKIVDAKLDEAKMEII